VEADVYVWCYTLLVVLVHARIVSDIAIFVLKKDVKLQPTSMPEKKKNGINSCEISGSTVTYTNCHEASKPSSSSLVTLPTQVFCLRNLAQKEDATEQHYTVRIIVYRKMHYL